ncbi:MAG TPA: tryptophan 7-halogenase [Candidatus Bathyarchaeia archaeon]|jgi:flavin-dependent dehydrogenase|nr:tryptophan 7-halogenase [Candidatus Bathyarchaeia archaeon]
MSERLNADICVMGGGPAGAAVAARLSQLGHSVVVVEKQIFPRAHVGESVTPGVLPLLDVLGIRERIERQDFPRPERVLSYWPPHRGYKSIGPVPGFQVDRAKFDMVMLDAAREAGAIVLEGSHLLRREQTSTHGWNLTIAWRGKLVFVESCFVIDATGRRGLMGGKKRRYGKPTFALWKYWRACPISGRETRVEAGAEQWYWGAPLPDGTFNATVFIDTERFKHDLQRLGSVESVYQHLLMESELMAGCSQGHSIRPATVCDVTCYADDDPVLCNLIKVGEALFSVDPLSSQGVQTALGTGLHAAAVVHTVLRRSGDQKIAEQFYRERQLEAVAFHRSTAAYLYSQVALERAAQFWQERAGEQARHQERSVIPAMRPSGKMPTGRTRVKLAPEIQIVSLPCLEGDFIVTRSAVAHPDWARPTVFLGGVAIAPLLNCLRTTLTVEETLRAWSQKIHKDHITGVLGWLWGNGLIIEGS